MSGVAFSGFGVMPAALNPTFNHKDTNNTKHTPDISVRTLFVSLCLGGRLLSRSWGAGRALTWLRMQLS